MLNVMISEV